jgi:hypothetical protein
MEQTGRKQRVTAASLPGSSHVGASIRQHKRMGVAWRSWSCAHGVAADMLETFQVEGRDVALQRQGWLPRRIGIGLTFRRNNILMLGDGQWQFQATLDEVEAFAAELGRALGAGQQWPKAPDFDLMPARYLQSN